MMCAYTAYVGSDDHTVSVLNLNNTNWSWSLSETNVKQAWIEGAPSNNLSQRSGSRLTR